MQTENTIQSVRDILKPTRGAGRIIGLVPTMGALHIGHISLIQAAKEQTDFVVVSIFVNPTQFGPLEDFDNYPRPIDKDIQICEQNGVDLVFAPSVNEMYPAKNITWVEVEKLTEPLCGRSRPGHFRGVATVCTKLFNIVQPDIAFFGQKDAQQAVVIKRMVADLNMPLKIVVCPTVREADGLAVSSRNKYLSQEERKDAPLIYQSLSSAEKLIKSGQRQPEKIIEEVKTVIGRSNLLQIEYIEIVDAETLERITRLSGRILIAVAVKFGSARLIDNILVDAS
ncbi:MAG: pantoate--beta-alanine ligase [Sedimentisphaerales bacterium]|nr:pantoate--beta-alanine ligase [Sedimentisphaerales bacterium]